MELISAAEVPSMGKIRDAIVSQLDKRGSTKRQHFGALAAFGTEGSVVRLFDSQGRLPWSYEDEVDLTPLFRSIAGDNNGLPLLIAVAFSEDGDKGSLAVKRNVSQDNMDIFLNNMHGTYTSALLHAHGFSEEGSVAPWHPEQQGEPCPDTTVLYSARCGLPGDGRLAEENGARELSDEERLAMDGIFSLLLSAMRNSANSSAIKRDSNLVVGVVADPYSYLTDRVSSFAGTGIFAPGYIDGRERDSVKEFAREFAGNGQRLAFVANPDTGDRLVVRVGIADGETPSTTFAKACSRISSTEEAKSDLK